MTRRRNIKQPQSRVITNCGKSLTVPHNRVDRVLVGGHGGEAEAVAGRGRCAVCERVARGFKVPEADGAVE